MKYSGLGLSSFAYVVHVTFPILKHRVRTGALIGQHVLLHVAPKGYTNRRLAYGGLLMFAIL
jgi:hypothetical protein